MSHGPGRIERAVFAALEAKVEHPSERYIQLDRLKSAKITQAEYRAFTVTDLCHEVFRIDGKPTRAQRVSVLRAVHGAMKRASVARERARALRAEAKAATDAEFRPELKDGDDDAYRDVMMNQPAYKRSMAIPRSAFAANDWRVTQMPDRTVLIHDRSRPIQIWAVQITPAGLVWSDAVEIEEITYSCVSVRYAGVRAPLNRSSLWFEGVAFYRGVYFVNERSGLGAATLDEFWWDQYGHLLPKRMSLAAARELLRLPKNYTEADILRAFRREAKCCHPDVGGTAEQFRALVEARDRLLASLGTSAPAPTMPTYAPIGTRWIRTRSTRRTIGTDRLKRLA